MSDRRSDREAAEGNWSFLREIVHRLASPAHEQLQWTGSMCIDELALDFDAVYPASWQSREAGWISEELAALLSAIDQKLIVLTGQGPSAWTEEALRFYPGWEELRRIAHRALVLMPAQPWSIPS
ncbi:hypothetical protein ACFV0L_35915 [Streptosporangium canum]|uniref:hypothetical protein n=1 Tax=Streptosporangium canum TaxID=324952 RepID=UPI0036843910